MAFNQLQRDDDCSITEFAIEPGSVRDSHNSLNDSDGGYTFETVSSKNRELSSRGNRSALSQSFHLSPIGRREKHNSATLPLIPQTLSRNSLGSLTIDKLRVENLTLHEREEQLDHLTKCLESLSQGLVQRHLILISGVSGSGKTALSNSLRKPVTKLGGLFVGGKFDFNNSHEPYSGVAMACVELCEHIFYLQNVDADYFHKIIQRIRKDLASELALLIKIVPALMEVTDFSDVELTLSEAGSSSAALKNRLNFAFQRFLRIISNEFGPLVLVLDDLQWADASSLDLLEACLLDRTNTNVMIVGTYRSNEVEETHILHHAINRLTVKREALLFEITQISIGNLCVEAVDDIIATLLSMDRDVRTMGLARICFKKTQGNPFFLLQFLHLLRDIGLLRFNFGTLSWMWNDNELDASTGATDNVVDLLTAKMALLPQHLLDILKIAACLGCTFKETCLRPIWEALRSGLSGELDKTQTLTSGLEHLVQEGYITRHSNTSSLTSTQTLSWTHDKVQEAAMTLIPLSERALFKFQAGDILLSKLSTDDLESSIFTIVYLLDAEEDQTLANDSQRLKIAWLNYDASVKALAISAFDGVAKFSAKGIKLLPENHWIDHYDLSLNLYSIAAQAEGCLGNTDIMERYCHEVLSQKERPTRDKFRVYCTLVDSMTVRGLQREAALLLTNVLGMCNCNFPKGCVSVGAALISCAFSVKSKTKAINPEQLCEMKNPLVYDLMTLLHKLVTCFFLAGDPRSLLVAFRCLEWTMTYGYCDLSPTVFAAMGIGLMGFIDFAEATWWGEQAIKLLKKCKSLTTSSRTMYVVYARIFSWTKPLMALLQPLHHSYYVGLQSGDIFSSMWSICNWLSFRYITGTPLKKLEIDLRLFSKQMKDLNGETQLLYTNCVHQVVLNLMGYSDGNLAELRGAVFTMEDHIRCNQDSYLSVGIRPWQGLLLTYFGDHTASADFILQHGHNYFRKKFSSSPNMTFDNFLRGISCFAAARETGKRKYAKMGEKLRSIIKKWHYLGNPNVTHYMYFLDAESAALRNKIDDAIKWYLMTIRLAGRTGFIQDSAFACERLAEFYLQVLDNKNEATYRMEQSIRYWSEWGAVSKVKALKIKYSNLFAHPMTK